MKSTLWSTESASLTSGLLLSPEDRTHKGLDPSHRRAALGTQLSLWRGITAQWDRTAREGEENDTETWGPSGVGVSSEARGKNGTVRGTQELPWPHSMLMNSNKGCY